MNPVSIGPYQIDRRLGAGGMGNVYLARHKVSGEVLAVKELPSSMAREDGFVNRFNREIEAMKKLDSPNIVKFHDSGFDGETYYYSMEYVDGETITSRLRRDRRIPWQETVEIARQICVGLKHAHDVGVVHRDLKPSNLMLRKDGIVKIADFGVAQVFAADRLTSTGGVIGTAEFMSPEQVTGSRTDKRSDLYSLGAVIYTMLVGQPPFLGTTASDIMQKQRFGRFDPPKKYVDEIPSGLNDLVCQLLEKDPDKRPPNAFVTSRRLQELKQRIELEDSRFPATSNDETRVAPRNSNRTAPGATLIRDLFRIEATASENADVVARALNNTWVLMGLLGLLVLVVFWVSRLSMSASKVTDDDPIFKSDAEAERIIQRARWRWRSGDPVTAVSQLDALQAIVESDPNQQHLLKSINQLRNGIRNQVNARDQHDFARQSLDRAHQLPEHQRDQSRRIYEGIITLYGTVPGMVSLTDEARQSLKGLDDADRQKH